MAVVEVSQRGRCPYDDLDRSLLGGVFFGVGTRWTRPCLPLCRSFNWATISVVLIAAENGAIPGGKVGGVGDVVRDLPAALVANGWQATVLTPSYGSFHTLPGTRELAAAAVRFRGEDHNVRVFELQTGTVRTILFEHAQLVPTTPGRVYHDDGADRPYATDGPET